MFKAVSPKVDIQKLEKEGLDYWRANRIFQRSMEERAGNTPYITYEGPPTVNGNPGVHHVLARAFKDIFPRYKTMRGYYALRQGGWDTHGLPVELAIEKELGFSHKYQIEEYGIDKFNEKCRASVMRNIGAWERFTERMAYWTDLDKAYVTFTNDYMESIWWVLKQLWEKDLLYKGLKVVPYCARCGTPLSSHEVALGYKDVRDPSVYVRFPLRDKPGVYFLVWTTTPWTLPANVALAIGENVDYVQVEGPVKDSEATEQLILAEARMSQVLQSPENYKVIRKFKGKELLGEHYRPLYSFLPVEKDYAYVVAGDFVSTEDGSGIVHIAPAFGVDDMAVGKANNLPVLQTVNAEGAFIDAVKEWRGMWVKDADPEITRDLRRRGLLYKSDTYEHTYPFCWRCGTPLLYFARDTWFIRTTEYRDKMIAENEKINWVPGHVRDGRFGNWLTELKDWALGRERYWGTTLPIWVDDKTGDMLCVGSVAELSQLVGRDLSGLDLHRPYVDEITFPNPNGSGGTMRRVPEVIDVWFDSGAMPVAQWGYPAHDTHNMFESQFPADYICEAVDQTRGWFYTLHSISTMLFEQASFKNVICLGLILDEKGEKMSKSKGNVVDPWDVLNTHGADAFRWYLFTSGPPGEPRRFSKDLVGKVISNFWLTLWNTYSFFVTYANLDNWTPTAQSPAVANRDPLDQWVLAELHQLVGQVTEAFDNYDVPGATRPIQTFIDNLSNWYLRLSRRRFWKSESDSDKLAAYATLYECLVTVSRLLAPTMPFVADTIYRNLVLSVDANAAPSVHLTFFPEADTTLINQPLIAEMRLAQRLVSLGRAARENVNIGVRQPLASASFAVRDHAEAATVQRLEDLISSELNVKQVSVLLDAGSAVEYKLNPLPSVLGKKFGKDFPRVQKHLREGDANAVRGYAEALLRAENVTVSFEDADFEVTPDEVEVKRIPKEGYTVAEDSGYVAALDVRLTDELVMEGMAREVVRRVQTLRREADFDISDQIEICYVASDRLAKAVVQFASYIQAETLATILQTGEPANGYHRAVYAPDPDGDPRKDTSIDGETLKLAVKRI
ncbi:MAG: isoleucyl-tRNA synthetase [Chloroflexi bacterium OLB15]|nr:MAG: isoleucyl-tRNA synthetase [Chloroflexi bacterium OLB15]